VVPVGVEVGEKQKILVEADSPPLLRIGEIRDSTPSWGRNSALLRPLVLVLGCSFIPISSTFRSRHQSFYLSSMVGYSTPEIQSPNMLKDPASRP
jgi:hypothetical protein